MSTILIIFELTGDYQITMALMAAVVTSNMLTSHFLKSESLFHLQLKKRGLDLEGGYSKILMRRSLVRDFMHQDYTIVSAETSAKEIQDLILNQDYNTIFIVNPENQKIGIITLSELRKSFSNKAQPSPLIAENLMTPSTITLSAEATLEEAYNLFEASIKDRFAVVSSEQTIIGILHHRDILRALAKSLTGEEQK